MNLFDVHRGCHNMNPKPRSATADEVRAYLKWLASERGVFVPHDAEYQPAGIWSRTAGEYVLEMPGYGQKQVATCEVLDDAGNVVRSMTLPQDKRGGIPATAKQVQEWTGLKPVKASKAKRATPTADVAAAPEPVEPCESAPPTSHAPEAVEVPQRAPEPEIQTAEPLSETQELPAPVDIDAVTARLDALERAVATLSAELGPIAEPARPARTAAHERAVRRAWAERVARRAAAADSERLRHECEDWEALQHRTWAEAMGHKVAHRRAVLTARRHWKMRLVARGQYQAAEREARHERAMRHESTATGRALAVKARRERDRARGELAKIKRDLADPSQPERASDVARLVTERDQARTALAAVTARADRQQAALDQMAGQFENLVSRLTKAEAALRASKAA